MTIREIAYKINRYSFSSKGEFYRLQEFRSNYYGHRTQSTEPFAGKGIKDQEDYAFHSGGRDEFQFNIGTDSFKKNKIFRYGLAFSLSTGQSLHDPKATFRPLIKQFNTFLQESDIYLKGFQMWYYKNNSFEKYFDSIRRIDSDMFQTNNFIFIGKYFEKDMDELDNTDISEIVKTFDYLMPVYKFVQFGINLTENRISKVCWNENDWVSPTGKKGKSSDPDSFESLHGYGHEEWLFDFDKTIEGYHYCMLQTVSKGRDSYIWQLFNVELYSHNSETKTNYRIGSIRNLEVIPYSLSKQIHDVYVEKGWKDIMKEQIQEVDGDYKYFQNLNAGNFFNVRFIPADAKLYKPQQNIEDFENTIGTYRYQFRKNEFKEEDVLSKSKFRQFKFEPSKFKKSVNLRTSKRKEKISQIYPLHDIIQEGLYNYLLTLYSAEEVSSEHNTGLNTKIDIAIKKNNKVIMFEVKSYPSIMVSIREAIGQLFEYAYWPEPMANIQELIIVSHLKADLIEEKYIKFLREKYSMNIYYQQFDLKLLKLLDKV